MTSAVHASCGRRTAPDVCDRIDRLVGWGQTWGQVPKLGLVVVGQRMGLRSRSQRRIDETDADTLVGCLRAEVGNAITTWVLWRQIIVHKRSLKTTDIAADMRNQELAFWSLLSARLEEDLIAALSELAETKTGRTNFFFAEQKFGLPHDRTEVYRKFVSSNGLDKKRNREIAHREQPRMWMDPDLFPTHIPYRVLVKVLAMAVREMKKIDLLHLGPAAPYLWAEVRRKRYQYVSPARVAYILLPHMALPEHAREMLERY